MSVAPNCSALRPTNPDVLVANDQVAFAVKAFMDASVRLLEFYGYSDAAISATPVAASANRLTGVGNKRDYTLVGFDCTPYASVNPCPNVGPPGTALNFVATQDVLINEYVYTGWQTAQILCRNYLSGLSEKNSAFEAIRRELNISGGLAQLTMQTAAASARSIAYFGAAQSFLNSTLDNFSDYEFLTPDQASLQDLVFRAQASLADYYLRTVEGHPIGLVGAINAIHTIEFQCTRPGLRRLISRAVTTGQPEVKKGVVTLTQPPPPAPQTPRSVPPVVRITQPVVRITTPPTPTVDLDFLQTQFTKAKQQLQMDETALATLQATIADKTQPPITIAEATKAASTVAMEIAKLNKRLKDLNDQANGKLK